jgi:hypothetical protein
MATAFTVILRFLHEVGVLSRGVDVSESPAGIRNGCQFGFVDAADAHAGVKVEDPEFSGFEQVPHRLQAIPGINGEERFEASLHRGDHDIEPFSKREQVREDSVVGVRQIAGGHEDIGCHRGAKTGEQSPEGASRIDVRQNRKAIRLESLRTIPYKDHRLHVPLQGVLHGLEDRGSAKRKKGFVLPHPGTAAAHQEYTGDVGI